MEREREPVRREDMTGHPQSFPAAGSYLLWYSVPYSLPSAHTLHSTHLLMSSRSIPAPPSEGRGVGTEGDTTRPE